MVSPGVSRVDEDHRLLQVTRRGADVSVLPITMKIAQRSDAAPEIHHLRPLSTYSSPSRVIESWMLVASDAGDVGFGHGERRADLAFEQRLQPLLLLGVGAKHRQHFHVAGIREQRS